MTQLVEEQDRWTEHVATHVTPVTKSQLFELAREEDRSFWWGHARQPTLFCVFPRGNNDESR
jgi:hypothetical protein